MEILGLSKLLLIISGLLIYGKSDWLLPCIYFLLVLTTVHNKCCTYLPVIMQKYYKYGENGICVSNLKLRANEILSIRNCKILRLANAYVYQHE